MAGVSVQRHVSGVFLGIDGTHCLGQGSDTHGQSPPLSKGEPVRWMDKGFLSEGEPGAGLRVAHRWNADTS